MKWSKLLVSTLVVSSLAAAAPAFAEREIADEPAWDSEPAPHNYDPQKREEADKRVFDKESFQLAANPVIVIDPGHGGDDPGAVGNGLKEKDLTLDIGLRAKNYIVANYPATVYMTRSSDTTVSLSSRTSFANAQNADFFVSMHINAATDASANGVETRGERICVLRADLYQHAGDTGRDRFHLQRIRRVQTGAELVPPNACHPIRQRDAPLLVGLLEKSRAPYNFAGWTVPFLLRSPDHDLAFRVAVVFLLFPLGQGKGDGQRPHPSGKHG
jgi:hypothetical protein